MKNELTPEEYEDWALAYKQEPWGDFRNDLRNAATFARENWRPTHEGEQPPDDLPHLLWPYWEDKEQKVADEVAAFQALKKTKFGKPTPKPNGN